MAKSMKKMEATLETVLKSIATPGHAIASTAGMLDAGTPQKQGLSPGDDYSASESGGSRMSVVAGDHQAVASSSTGVEEGVRFESGLGRQGMQWNAWNGHQGSDGRDGPRLHSLPENTLVSPSSIWYTSFAITKRFLPQNPLGLLAE